MGDRRRGTGWEALKKGEPEGWRRWRLPLRPLEPFIVQGRPRLLGLGASLDDAPEDWDGGTGARKKKKVEEKKVGLQRGRHLTLRRPRKHERASRRQLLNTRRVQLCDSVHSVY